jgi:hypothetical protein
MYGTDEKEYQKIADAAWAKSRTTGKYGDYSPKAQMGLSKKFIIRYDYSLMAAANINMRFTKTNDLISTDFVSVDPALGFEFGYTDLVLSVQE